MKRFLSILLVLTIILGACSLTACEFIENIFGQKEKEQPEAPKASEGLEFEATSDKTGYKLIGIGDCTDTEIIVPSEHDGKPVVSITKEAFAENDKIVSIVIPKTVTSIGSKAFYKCASLKKAELPEGLLSLGSEAFACCKNLKEINIPTTLTKIPDMAFMLCTSLETAKLHDGITELGENCFAGCISLKYLYIPMGITLDNFTEFYVFLNSLNSFEVSDSNPDFYDIDGNLYLKVEEYGESVNAFMAYSMGKPENSFTVPSSVDVIMPAAFNFLPWDAEDIDSIPTPDLENVKYHSNLKEVVISDGVETIMMLSFVFCTDLERVVIPRSVTSIGTSAFTYCTNLKTIEFEGTKAEWNAIDKGSEWFAGTPIEQIICLDGMIAPNTPSVEKEEVVLWVSTVHGIKEFTEQKIEEFLNKNPEYRNKYYFTVQTVGEGDAASEVMRDLASAADLYCFSQDNISRLVQAGALSSLGQSDSDMVKTNNDIGSVNAASVAGTLYAYPMTSDNGYFLYYDSRYISDEEAQSIEGIIAACERNGKKFGFNITNAWYMASFFFAQPVGSNTPLCESKWIYSNGSPYPIAVSDTFNSPGGLIAMKAMNALAKSDCFYDNSDNFTSTAAIVTGIWSANAAESEYGDYMKVTKLPTYTVDGETYQLGSYAGYKLVGIKPQEDSERAKMLNSLAAYLTSEEVQIERYYKFYWGPSNVNAQQNEDVKINILLSALIEQNIHAQPQGTIPGEWWVYAAELANFVQDDGITEADILAALEEYEEKINNIVVNK